MKLLLNRRLQSAVSIMLPFIIAAFLVAVVMSFVRLPSDTAPQAEDVLLQEILSAYDKGFVTNLEDVGRIKEILAEESPAVTDVELSAVLKRWLLRILRESDTTDSEEIEATHEFVNILFDQEESERPFSILPGNAQVVATKLKESIEKGDEGKGEALDLLVELATSLGSKVRAQEDEVRSTRRLTIYSVVFGATGVFLFLVSVPVPRIVRWVKGRVRSTNT